MTESPLSSPSLARVEGGQPIYLSPRFSGYDPSKFDTAVPDPTPPLANRSPRRALAGTDRGIDNVSAHAANPAKAIDRFSVSNDYDHLSNKPWFTDGSEHPFSTRLRASEKFDSVKDAPLSFSYFIDQIDYFQSDDDNGNFNPVKKPVNDNSRSFFFAHNDESLNDKVNAFEGEDENVMDPDFGEFSLLQQGRMMAQVFALPIEVEFQVFQNPGNKT